jgi:hypothetical protein
MTDPRRNSPRPVHDAAPGAAPDRPRGSFWLALIVAVIALAIVYLILAARR